MHTHSLHFPTPPLFCSLLLCYDQKSLRLWQFSLSGCRGQLRLYLQSDLTKKARLLRHTQGWRGDGGVAGLSASTMVICWKGLTVADSGVLPRDGHNIYMSPKHFIQAVLPPVSPSLNQPETFWRILFSAFFLCQNEKINGFLPKVLTYCVTTQRGREDPYHQNHRT